MENIYPETYISVDIETSGPIPGEYSMLSLGASTVYSSKDTFYVELQPISGNFVPDALAVSGLSLEFLRSSGLAPEVAIRRFEEWVIKVSNGSRPVFIGFNAGFDWSFVNWYFHKYLKRNPFGYAALDIKSYYMAAKNCSWFETKMSRIPYRYRDKDGLSHNALEDALLQGELFKRIRQDLGH